MRIPEKTNSLVEVGAESAPRLLRVEAGLVLRFLDALGAPTPEESGDIRVPPTFPTTLQLPAPGLENVDPARVLHGEQEYVYERPLRIGDVLTCQSRVAEVSQKATRLGDVTIVVVETTGRENQGDLVLTERMTLIVR